MLKSCFNIDKLNRKNWYLYIIAAIFVLGIVLRTMVYVYNRPLWLDECQLSISLLSRNIFGFFSSLDYQQTSPPIFLMIVKLFSLVFGIKEYALRMYSFICGLAAIFVFYKFSKQFLIRKWSVILASFLFAVNRELIYYSQEFKQYSSDVLCFMLTFMFLNKLSLKDLSIKKTILYSFGISILPLISIPTCFVIGGWFIREIIFSKLKYIKKMIIFSLPVAVVNILYCIFVILPQHNMQIKRFKDFWSQGFINFNIINNFNILKENLIFFFSPTNYPLLKAVLLLIGLYYVFRRIKSPRNILLITFFIVMCIFSYFQIYPIFQRVALYTLPLLIVFITKPFDYLSIKKKWYSLIISAVFICAFWGYNPTYFMKFDNFNPLKYRPYANDAKNLMKRLIKNYSNKKACIVVNNSSYPEFFYYSNYYKFKPKCVKRNKYPLQLNNLIQLNELKDGEYWIFYSFDYPNCPVIPLTREWAHKYEVMYEYRTPGKNTYLLNMRKY